MELPPLIKQSLARLCFGLPDAKWVDPNDFVLTLRELPKISSDRQFQLLQALHLLSHSPMKLQLEGVGFTNHKNEPSSVWARVSPSDLLNQFLRKIDRLLQNEGVSQTPPYIYLGTFPKTSAGRLPNYLEAFHSFSSSQFEIYSFTLAELLVTSKNRIITPQESFPLYGKG